MFITIGIILLSVIGLWLLLAAMFRIVVPTNEVHIVQSGEVTQPYGKDQGKGAVYYNRPSWLPSIGITRIILPMSIFTVDLGDYYAYDQGKVPFVVDIKAWFRVNEASIATQRIEDFEELKTQLDDILKGCVRKILATSDVEQIMSIRKEFGEQFRQEVLDQAKDYGVDTINIEFMDIRDPQDGGSKVIANIMNKKKSEIERESRVTVAENLKTAKIAEIEAQKEADVKAQEAMQLVGVREAQKEQEVGISREKAKQLVQEEAKVTTEKDMAIIKVQQVKSAEIEKEKQVIQAQQDKETISLRAEAEANRQTLEAKGEMQAELFKAQGIEAVGKANAEAEKLMQLAPVSAQIELAKEIGSNEYYIKYLLGLEGIKAEQIVGVAKADALKEGDLKIIANGGGDGTVNGGMNSILDIFSGKGGSNIATMLETLCSTPVGKKMIEKVLGKDKDRTEDMQVVDTD